ncbi:hypothetical protein EV144_1011439 [Flavobacterium sp. 270]|nr:hypothetical protein EV144_1011439 [Flavobacterium sp. 270]
MLFQFLLNIIAFLIKCIAWIVVAFLAIPFGVYYFLMSYFPEFTLAYDFSFWAVFSILSIIGFVILWKPIIWTVGIIQTLGAGA